MGLAEALENKAWKPLERQPKYEILTEPRPKAFRYKEQVVVEREFENQKLVGEALAEIEYQPGQVQPGVSGGDPAQEHQRAERGEGALR